MTEQKPPRTNQDWRTSDPIWADDIRPATSTASVSTELYAASFGLVALFAAIVAVLA